MYKPAKTGNSDVLYIYMIINGNITTLTKKVYIPTYNTVRKSWKNVTVVLVYVSHICFNI